MTGHVREALGAYVLGALAGDEHEAVRGHLSRCPQCAGEHARLAGLRALLDAWCEVETARNRLQCPRSERPKVGEPDYVGGGKQ